jgi:hypothetical protein
VTLLIMKELFNRDGQNYLSSLVRIGEGTLLAGWRSEEEDKVAGSARATKDLGRAKFVTLQDCMVKFQNGGAHAFPNDGGESRKAHSMRGTEDWSPSRSESRAGK